MRLIALGVAAGLVALMAPPPAQASEDKVEDYGVAPLVPCPTLDHPPSESEATLMIICSESYDDFGHGAVYRTFDVKLQVGKPRPYAVGDPGGNEIDPNAPVYPIRGTKTTSVCSPVSDFMKNAGKNCVENDWKGDGRCFQTPFGDWKCTLNGLRTDSRANRPPPAP